LLGAPSSADAAAAAGGSDLISAGTVSLSFDEILHIRQLIEKFEELFTHAAELDAAAKKERAALAATMKRFNALTKKFNEQSEKLKVATAAAQKVPAVSIRKRKNAGPPATNDGAAQNKSQSSSASSSPAKKLQAAEDGTRVKTIDWYARFACAQPPWGCLANVAMLAVSVGREAAFRRTPVLLPRRTEVELRAATTCSNRRSQLSSVIGAMGRPLVFGLFIFLLPNAMPFRIEKNRREFKNFCDI
jgi:hypothetical protein